MGGGGAAGGVGDEDTLFEPEAASSGLEGDAVYHASAQDLLRVSQFLSLHAPHTPETHHFLNVENIALLPAGAIVINAARGGWWRMGR